MKRTKTPLILALGAILILTCSCCGGKTEDGSQPKGIAKADVDSVGYMMGYSFGMQLKEGGFGPLNYSDIDKGMRDAGKGVDVDVNEFRRIVNGFLDNRRKAIAEEMIGKSETYLEAMRQQEGVEETMDGLLYKILDPGNKTQPTVLDTVEVNYEGTNLDGEVFDSSYQRGTTAKFPVSGVIKGWSEGVQLIGEGGSIMLYIPANLAYGESSPNMKIRGNEALTFKVELIKVMPYIPKENK